MIAMDCCIGLMATNIGAYFTSRSCRTIRGVVVSTIGASPWSDQTIVTYATAKDIAATTEIHSIVMGTTPFTGRLCC